MKWTAPSRAAALDRLNEFLPRAGRHYHANRNEDRGPEDRTNVSGLSPFVSLGLLHEEEIVRAVLDAHPKSAAEKFVDEVCWRTYWKGWLEHHPSVWSAYGEAAERTPDDDALARRLERARAGETGIDCFDAWIGELDETGYLHNHARMWFASIWIFTLGLPWALGARHFVERLLDADAASNTLSWRWVGGLHTKGKTYAARASNVARFTGGRFDPRGELDERPRPLADDGPHPRVAPREPSPAAVFDEPGPVAWLSTPESLHPLPELREGLDVVAGFCLAPIEERSSPLRRRFVERAVSRAAEEGGAALGLGHPLPVLSEIEIAERLAGSGASALVAQHHPAGPGRSRLDALAPLLEARGLKLLTRQRRWDRELWPHATRGFFGLKKALPRVLPGLVG